MSITRRQSRELAFQFLYGNLIQVLPQTGSRKETILFDRTEVDTFAKSFSGISCDDFAWHIVSGVGQNLPTIDTEIEKTSANWKIERMSKIDLSLLRLACYEILFCPDIPKTVSINEAIELAKSFGSEESAAFVNGILDKFSKPV